MFSGIIFVKYFINLFADNSMIGLTNFEFPEKQKRLSGGKGSRQN